MSDLDAVDLAVARHRLAGIAEEMGEVLVHSASSPNVTERRDCSTALFDAAGRLVAQAEHIPVHLGAMPRAVEAARTVDPGPGDVVVTNDPYAGGTHLPDVTLVAPVGAPSDGGTDDQEIVAYAAARAHHADVGGATPGSMPAGATDVFAEGIRIPPITLVADGTQREDVRNLFLANVRDPDARRADLRAQLAATERGVDRLRSLRTDEGPLAPVFAALRAYSRERTRAAIDELPDGTYEARDVLEGDGVADGDVRIAVSVTVDGETLAVDFAGTAGQVPGSLNAPVAVVESAVYFVVRCLTDSDVPANAGCYEPISIAIPDESLLNPDPPAAVSGGNVETSQRIADVVQSAFASAAPDRVPAAGQGTMNNLVVGGADFSYYETLGGGAGAGPDGPGGAGVHVGMTNTRNTPIETLEAAHPVQVLEYAMRTDSGGEGRHDGGDGLIREIELQRDATVSLLTDRRRHGPPGRAGGADGRPGRNLIDGDPVPAKVTRSVPAGATVRVVTPGGGGFGDPDASDGTDPEFGTSAEADDGTDTESHTPGEDDADTDPESGTSAGDDGPGVPAGEADRTEE